MSEEISRLIDMVDEMGKTIDRLSAALGIRKMRLRCRVVNYPAGRPVALRGVQRQGLRSCCHEKHGSIEPCFGGRKTWLN
jgi:hypothetical protein